MAVTREPEPAREAGPAETPPRKLRFPTAFTVLAAMNFARPFAAIAFVVSGASVGGAAVVS